MKKTIYIGLFLIVFQVAFGLNIITAKADATGQWNPDARVPGYLNDTFTPFLVADRNRTVHAFASQWISYGSRKLAVVYRKWSLAGGWTRPVDIILAPEGDARILGAFLDPLDRMHIIFMLGEARAASVYYSSAPASNADLVAAWSAPVMVGENALGLNSAAIIGDDRGNLFVIYSGNRDGNGVYFISSADSGSSWSDPAPIFQTFDTTLVPYSLRLAISQDKYLRAAWNVVTTVGVDETLHFVNYDISSAEWGIPVELDRRIEVPEYFGPSFPAMVDNGSEIVILYNGGNPYAGQFVGPGRPVMRASISSDGGITWGSPDNPFPLLNGRSGEHSLAIDSTGAVHGLFVMRIDQYVDGENKTIGGIWHSKLQDGIWSNPDRFVTTYSPHDVRTVISQGNVLLVVWREDPGAGKHGVWFSYTVLDAPELPVTPLATAPVPVSIQPTPTVFIPVLDTPATVSDNNGLDDSAPSQWRTNPVFPLVVGIIPVFLIMIGMFVIFRLLSNRRE